MIEIKIGHDHHLCLQGSVNILWVGKNTTVFFFFLFWFLKAI